MPIKTLLIIFQYSKKSKPNREPRGRLTRQLREWAHMFLRKLEEISNKTYKMDKEFLTTSSEKWILYGRMTTNKLLLLRLSRSTNISKKQIETCNL